MSSGASDAFHRRKQREDASAADTFPASLVSYLLHNTPNDMRRRETSLDAYFSVHSPLPPGDLSTISSALMAAQSHSISRISAPRSIRTRRSIIDQSCDSTVSSLSARHKLVEAKRLKQELEDRLSFVGGQIEEIRRQAQTPQSVGLRRRRIAGRRDCSEGGSERTISEERGNEAGISRVSLLKRLQKEKDERRKKVQAELEQRQLRGEERNKEERRKEDEHREKRREGMMEELRKRHDSVVLRKEERRKELAEADKRFKEVISAKPLYESLEEQFHANVVLPELQRQQEALETKKESVSFDSVLRHSQQVRATEEEMERKRRERLAKRKHELHQFHQRLLFFRPKAAEIVELEAHQLKQASVQRFEASRQCAIRKHRYGLLVRELFKPKISKLKQLEAEFHRQRAINQSFSAMSDRPARRVEKAVTAREHRSVRKVRGLTRKQKSDSTQSLPDTNGGKAKNYLAELKEKRETSASARTEQRYESKWQVLLSDSSNPNRIPSVQRELHRMETWARDQENLLSGMDADWKHSMQTREEVSSLYINSIKAKLAILGEIAAK